MHVACIVCDAIGLIISYTTTNCMQSQREMIKVSLWQPIEMYIICEEALKQIRMRPNDTNMYRLCINFHTHNASQIIQSVLLCDGYCCCSVSHWDNKKKNNKHWCRLNRQNFYSFARSQVQPASTFINGCGRQCYLDVNVWACVRV